MYPYIYRVKKIISIIDGDTIDCSIDLGFDISLEKRVRLAGIDTPESRTTNTIEKKFGLESKEWLSQKLKNANNIIIKTELPDSTEKYGRILGWLFADKQLLSINEEMINSGYAWSYNGEEKKKDFSILESRRPKFSFRNSSSS
jgi:micrococcal nuclease